MSAEREAAKYRLAGAYSAIETPRPNRAAPSGAPMKSFMRVCVP